MSQPKFNIIVVGAGISGLSAALGLQSKGHTVTVLERHADTQALGGPINMSPSASKILASYGLEGRIPNQEETLKQETQFRRYSDGKVLGRIPPGEAVKMYGAPVWTCSRYGYQKVFRIAAEERGIKIEWSTAIQTVDVENSTVVLQDGRKLQADLIVGADGVGSKVRRVVVDCDLERRHPVGAISIDVPLSRMRAEPELAALAEEKQNFWQGPGSACAAGAVYDTGLYNAVFTTEERMGSEGEWFVKGNLDQILERYKDWDPRLQKLIKITKPEDCFIWNITDSAPLPTWSRRNTVLIGDASHATTPFLGMGATTCVEDGASLAACLDRARSVDDIPRVLKAFEVIRKPRGEAVVKMSRETMKMWHLPNGEAQVQRDVFWGKLEALIGSKKTWDGVHVDEPPKSWTDPLFQPYLRGHDAVGFTNRKLDEMGI